MTLTLIIGVQIRHEGRERSNSSIFLGWGEELAPDLVQYVILWQSILLATILVLFRRVADVRRLIQARRHESISLHDVLQGLRLKECNEWLQQPDRYSTKQNKSVSDALKRQELLEQFVYWFFESFVLSLIKVSSLDYALFWKWGF